MSGLIPWRSIAVERRVPREVQQAVQAARHEGMVSAARIEGAGFATSVGLALIASLSLEERHHSELNPAVMGRMQIVVDTFATGVAIEVGRLQR